MMSSVKPGPTSRLDCPEFSSPADPDGNEIELYIDVQPEVRRDDPGVVFAPIKPLRL